MSKPLLIEAELDGMTFVFENPSYFKAAPATFDDPGWPETIEYTKLYIKDDPKQNDLTDLFEAKSLYLLEEKVMQQFRDPP